MPFGATLACLDSKRAIEIVGTAYYASGNSIGLPYPIIFYFEPLPG
jgi:hypothetical protein